MKLATLDDVLIDELRDLYSAESQLVKALPRMAKAASAARLRKGFETHLNQTRRHVERVRKACEALGASPNGKKCVAMQGLIQEGEELMSQDAEPELLDAALIAAAQKVEHYEIAGYGSVCAWAELLEHRGVLRLLQQTLEEEKETDEKLTRLAEESVNAKAAAVEPEENGGGLTDRLGDVAGKARELFEEAVDKTKDGMKAAGKMARKARRRMLK